MRGHCGKNVPTHGVQSSAAKHGVDIANRILFTESILGCGLRSACDISAWGNNIPQICKFLPLDRVIPGVKAVKVWKERPCFAEPLLGWRFRCAGCLAVGTASDWTGTLPKGEKCSPILSLRWKSETANDNWFTVFNKARGFSIRETSAAYWFVFLAYHRNGTTSARFWWIAYFLHGPWLMTLMEFHIKLGWVGFSGDSGWNDRFWFVSILYSTYLTWPNNARFLPAMQDPVPRKSLGAMVQSWSWSSSP